MYCKSCFYCTRNSFPFHILSTQEDYRWSLSTDAFVCKLQWNFSCKTRSSHLGCFETLNMHIVSNRISALAHYQCHVVCMWFLVLVYMALKYFSGMYLVTLYLNYEHFVDSVLQGNEWHLFTDYTMYHELWWGIS